MSMGQYHRQQPTQQWNTPLPQAQRVNFEWLLYTKEYLLFKALLQNIVPGCSLIHEGPAEMAQTFQSSLAAWPWSNSLQLHKAGTITMTFTKGRVIQQASPAVYFSVNPSQKKLGWSVSSVTPVSSCWKFTICRTSVISTELSLASYTLPFVFML